jgi:hypothetical protein
MLGATSNSCSINAINTSYTIGFNGGGWTFSTSGASSNGTSSFGNTNFNVSNMTLNNMHGSVYMLNNTVLTGTTATYFGALSGVKQFRLMNQSSPMITYYLSDNAINSGLLPQPRGQYVISTTGSTSQTLYRNGSLVFSGTSTLPTAINQPIYIAAVNNIGTAATFYSNIFSFLTFGQGLTTAQTSSLYSIIQTFQTSLSRNV